MNNIFQHRHYNYLALELPFILGLNEAEVSSMATNLKYHNENFNHNRFMNTWRREVERRNDEMEITIDNLSHYTFDTEAHNSGKCPVCGINNIGYYKDEVGVLRQCFDCGSERNDEMEITIELTEETGSEVE